MVRPGRRAAVLHLEALCLLHRLGQVGDGHRDSSWEGKGYGRSSEQPLNMQSAPCRGKAQPGRPGRAAKAQELTVIAKVASSCLLVHGSHLLQASDQHWLEAARHAA